MYIRKKTFCDVDTLKSEIKSSLSTNSDEKAFIKQEKHEDAMHILKDLDTNSQQSKQTNNNKNPSSSIYEIFVNYCNKNYKESQIYDMNFSIIIGNHKISRRIYIGSEFDLNIFTEIIFELFEFSNKSWRYKFLNFTLTGSPNDDNVFFETTKSKKYYIISLILLKKFNLKPRDRFVFIYDLYGEKWEINCKIETVTEVKDLMRIDYKNEFKKQLAFAKLKSIFRPILIYGENASPPEGLGGMNDILRLLRNKSNKDDVTTIKYLKYFKNIRVDFPEWSEYFDNITIDDYLKYFDFREMQKLLSKYNLLKFYDFDSLCENSLKNEFAHASFLSGSSFDLGSSKEYASNFINDLTLDFNELVIENEDISKSND